MTGPRETFRRIAIWTFVAAFFALGIWIWVLGQPTGLLGFAGWAVVGAVILTERPGNGMGRFLFTVTFFSALIMWGLVPELSLAMPPWVETLTWGISGPFWTIIWTVALFFPSGRLETRLAKAVFWIAIAFGSLLALGGLLGTAVLESGRPNPLAVPVLSVLEDFPDAVNFSGLVVIIGGTVLDLILRWRRAPAVERLQYRWFVSGTVAMVALVLIAIPFSLASPGTSLATAATLVATIALNLPPIAIGIAITRHGLYSIGRVISRTVSYAIVTLLAIGVYSGIVTSVTLLLPSLPSVGVALATLAAAAICLPLLRLVQRWLDRRFDRERYSAERVVTAFGEHVRSDADPGRASDELLQAVEQTLQPVTIGLWKTGVTR
jgi:hypothetical protein